MDARSRGRETDLRRRAVAWEPSADQSDGGAARGGGASFEPSGDAGGTTEGPELLAIRHFELRAPDGTLTDKMVALERALDLQVNGFN